jgi:hypothetical protein
MAKLAGHYTNKKESAKGATEEKEVKSEPAPDDKEPKPEPVETGAMGEVHHRMADHAAMMGRHVSDMMAMHSKQMGEHAAHEEHGGAPEALKAMHERHEGDRKHMNSRHMADMRALHGHHEKALGDTPAEKIVGK